MTPKERVIAQIQHKETDFIPYTLIFEDDADKTLENGALKRVNSYYGNDSWRAKFDNHIVNIPTIGLGVDYGSERTSCTDVYGTQWRVDKRPMHVEKPVLSKPSLSEYRFPKPEAFFDEGWSELALELIDEEKKEHFLITDIGFGLFERTWKIRPHFR